ncbi:MAG TPA: class I SAM-dependent methyltransferase [Bacteroidales bacterium]|nr:class I SAM-dependent methyltransferase [Bacteroidales bacterium]
MTEFKGCHNCGSKDNSVFIHCRDFFLSGEDFNIEKCNSCGFVFTANIPSEEVIQKYYRSKSYISHSDTRRGLTNRLYHIVRGWMLGRKLRLLKKASGKKVAKVLDIGSGTGYFQVYLTRKGWSVTGIEINSDTREYAKKNFSVESYSPDRMNQLDATSFDFITMWHTLEHFHDPEYYLKPAREILKDDGYLIIALPNHNSFDSEFYGKYWAAWDVPRHLWHFNPSSISTFIEKFGFKLRSAHRLPFDSFYISLLSERYRKSVFPVIQGSLIGFVSWITSLLRKKKSSSLIYIFEKVHS